MSAVTSRLSIPLSLLSMMVLTACGTGGSNSAPQFSSSSYSFTLNEDTTLSAAVSASDADGDTVTFQISSAANHGTFRLLNAGQFSYTPTENFYGADSVRLTATDGNASTEVTLSFTIDNVNDSPILGNSLVSVSSNGQTQGKVDATDIDGDSLTFALVTPPTAGELQLNTTTGSFVYTPAELEFTQQEFTVSVTDGKSPAVSNTIQLTPSYVTNQDKLNYYYSHSSSHLSIANHTQAEILDDTLQNTVLAEVAVGYLKAGFKTKAEQILTTQITELSAQAGAYRTLADFAADTGNQQLANTYLGQASTLYTRYILERGVNNIKAADAQFLMSLVNRFRSLGRTADADATATTITTLAEQVRSEVYSTTYGFFLTASRNNANALIDIWLASPTEQNRQLALKAATEFGSLSDKTGYQIVANGTYKGQIQQQLKALYSGQAAEMFFKLNDAHMAKTYIAKTVSLYTAADYDLNYQVAISPYAKTTALSYPTGLVLPAGLLAYYYPELSKNPAQAVGPVSGTVAVNIQTAVSKFGLQRRLENGDAVVPALDAEASKFAKIKDFYEMLFVQGATGLNLAWNLHFSGHDELALAVSNYAANVLLSDTYKTENTAPLDQLGSYGCYNLVKFQFELKADSTAKQTAQRCLNSAKSVFATGSTANAIAAYRYMLSLSKLASLAEEKTGLINGLNTLIASQTKAIERASSKLGAATLLASLGYFSEASTAFAQGLAELDAHLAADSLTQAELDTVLSLLNTTLGDRYEASMLESYYGTSNYLRAMRAAPSYGVTSQAATIIKALQLRADRIHQLFAKLAISEQNNLLQELVKMELAVNRADKAKALANAPTTAAADRLALLALTAKHVALTDHFPFSTIASIDTDHDGLPNFFTKEATEADILASGLIADQDADNDGIPDTQDANPLNTN